MWVFNLRQPESRRSGKTNKIKLTRSKTAFASIFHQHFPTEKLDFKASYRVKLLQLNVFLSHRALPGFPLDALPSLDSLKTAHSRRRSHFAPSRASYPLSRSWQAQLPVGVEYRSHYVELLRQTNPSIEIEPALVRLLPLFCKLSAYRGGGGAGGAGGAAMDGGNNSSGITKDWMNLAGQFMVQACLEMLLVHGSSDADLLREAFSWGWRAESSSGDELFARQNEHEISEWERIRTGWASVVSQ
jgi:hypothetical protein